MKNFQKIELYPITIITEPLSWLYRFFFLAKNLMKWILLSQSFGPKSVIESILSGFSQTPWLVWNYNPHEKDIYDIVYVPVWIDTLKYAISLKKQGIIQKLIVGPNISIPTSENDIFFHPAIDDIIVPSPWLQNYFSHILKYEDHRIHIVPAWVDDCAKKISADKIIVYKKDCPEQLFLMVCSYLEHQKFAYEVFIYGEFQKIDYLETLSRSRCMIYLQASESQWIALHEAWMKDVPTLVWNRWFWEYAWQKFFDTKISAPYLTENCGMFFRDENDFGDNFRLFFDHIPLYSPRKYSLEYFTHKNAIFPLISLLHY